MYKFSFIVPVYNGEAYLAKCINSILKIEREDYEIIIVNDGSTDGTQDIICEICLNHPNIKTIFIENSGLSVARNTGMDAAEGENIIFIDSDDWVEAELTYPMSIMANESIDMCFYNANNVFLEENYEIVRQDLYPFNEDEIYTGEQVLSKYTDYWIPNEVWHGIYKKSFLDENVIRFMPGVLYEDNSFWFDVMRCGKRIKYINRYCYNYLIRPGSIAFSDSNEKNIISVFTLMKEILSKINVTTNYLGCAAVKLPKLMRACEKRMDTAHLKNIVDKCEKIYTWREELLHRIDSLYGENSLCDLINKYILLSEFVFFLGLYKCEDERRVLNLRDKVILAFMEVMKEWPLRDESKIVGIYGSGRTSDVILNIYEKIYGKIKAKIFYIDSSKESGLYKHLNRQIINIDDLKKYCVCDVVICSNRYEEQMYVKTRELYPHIPVYRVYNHCKFPIENILTNNFVEILYNYRKIENEGKRRIILLGTPEYPNIGDHLIEYAEEQMFKQFDEYCQMVEVTNEDIHFFKCRLKKMICQDDLLVITGGGYFGTLWREAHYNEALSVINTYVDNSIIVMPQSVYFSDDYMGEIYREQTERIFNRDKLKIYLREIYSYEILKSIGVDGELLDVIPDIVFSLGQNEVNTNRTNKIGFFVRHDKESIIDRSTYECIQEYITKCGMQCVESSMQYHSFIFKENRKAAIDEKMDEIYNKYDLVVTDQLHCMIACALLRKPCIAFKSKSRKTEGVYKWIDGTNYVVLVDDKSNAIEAIENISGLEHSCYSSFDFSVEWNKLLQELGKAI